MDEIRKIDRSIRHTFRRLPTPPSSVKGKWSTGVFAAALAVVEEHPAGVRMRTVRKLLPHLHPPSISASLNTLAGRGKITKKLDEYGVLYFPKERAK